MTTIPQLEAQLAKAMSRHKALYSFAPECWGGCPWRKRYGPHVNVLLLKDTRISTNLLVSLTKIVERFYGKTSRIHKSRLLVHENGRDFIELVFILAKQST